MTVQELHRRLVDRIEGETGRDHRKLMNNTYGRLEGSWGPTSAPKVIIRYHNTDIAEITPETATYRTGGWWTYTTKERINEFMPERIRLYQERNVWYLTQMGRWTRWSRFWDEITLRDGPNDITIDGGPQLDDPDKELRAAIERYVKLYTDDKLLELVETARATGTNGDCLYCQLGHGGEHGDHLLYHIAEPYVMVTLAANAIKAAGYRPEIYLGAFSGGFMGTTIRRCIRKYMRKHLLHKGLHPLTAEELEAV